MDRVNIRQSYSESSDLLRRLAADGGFLTRVEAAARRCVRAVRTGKKILSFGNGGSAADAQHFAAELVGRFLRERPGYPAISLNTNVSVLTCLGNDYGYDRVFDRQIEALGRRGDVALAISTSGRSANVNRALRLAGRMGLYRIGLTGKTGGPMARLVDIELRVPAASTPRTQEVHIATLHILCDLIESSLARRRRR